MLIDLKYLIEKYHLDIRGIIHGGACKKEELSIYIANGIKEENVLWIEANPELCNGNYMINTALSDVNDEEVTLYITNNLQSSSILQLDKHKDFYPDIVVNREVKVSTKRLDALDINYGNYNFLNLDIQGQELKAIKGLGDKINNIDYIYTEVNVDSLYKDCAILSDIDDYLAKYNFKRVELSMTGAKWGDAFYIKNYVDKNNNFVTMHFMGGLGNQLYQFATLLNYAWKYNKIPIIDRRFVKCEHGPFIYDDKEKGKLLRDIIKEDSLGNYTKYEEDYLTYKEIPYYKEDLFIYGYYNDSRYFKDNNDKIIELFRNIFKNQDDINDEIVIHLRRGDYTTASYVFNVLDNHYYIESLNKLNISKNIYVVREYKHDKLELNNYAINYYNGNIYDDFAKIMNAKYIIIANSTFSWWAAYLSKADKVFYPLDWFNNLRWYSYLRYKVNGWIPISNRLDTLKTLSSQYINNKLFEDATIVNKVILDKIDDVNIYNNYIISAYYAKLIDKNVVYKFIDYINKNLISISLQGKINIDFALGDDAYHNINLENINVYMIARKEREDEMRKRLEKYNMKVTFISAESSNINSADACAKAHLKALKHINSLNTYPFLLLEDDVAITEHFKSNLKVHKTTDVLYLGLAKWGVSDGYTIYAHRNIIKASKDLGPYYKIYNMTSAHAILYINKTWVEKLIKYLEVAVVLRVPCDICNARLQNDTNVLAVEQGFFIQDSLYKPANTSEEINSDTIVDLRNYIQK